MSRPFNDDRQNSLTLGLRTYTGAPHPKCGTTERYVASGGCVHCARAKAAEQREELKVLKAYAAEQAEDQQREADGVNHPIIEGLDNDAEARQKAFEQSIEDML